MVVTVETLDRRLALGISDNDLQGTVPQGTPYQRRIQVCHSPKGCILTQNLKKITRRSFLYYCCNLWWFDIGSPGFLRSSSQWRSKSPGGKSLELGNRYHLMAGIGHLVITRFHDHGFSSMISCFLRFGKLAGRRFPRQTWAQCSRIPMSVVLLLWKQFPKGPSLLMLPEYRMLIKATEAHSTLLARATSQATLQLCTTASKFRISKPVNPGSGAIFIEGFVLCSQLFALTSVPIHSPPPDVSKNGLVWLAVGLYIASKVAYFLPW